MRWKIPSTGCVEKSLTHHRFYHTAQRIKDTKLLKNGDATLIFRQLTQSYIFFKIFFTNLWKHGTCTWNRRHLYLLFDTLNNIRLKINFYHLIGTSTSLPALLARYPVVWCIPARLKGYEARTRLRYKEYQDVYSLQYFVCSSRLVEARRCDSDVELSFCLRCVTDYSDPIFGRLFIYQSTKHALYHANNTECGCDVTYFCIRWLSVIPGQSCSWISLKVWCDIWVHYLLRYNTTHVARSIELHSISSKMVRMLCNNNNIDNTNNKDNINK